MLCSKEELEVYKKVDECMNSGLVRPYDGVLQSKLRYHTDKSNENIYNYLNSLCSNYSIGKSFL